MTQEELDAILDLHAKFLKKEDGGQQADLSFLELDGLILDNANLSESLCIGTNFSRASVAGANFQGADLNGACFEDCLLSKCNFLGANLMKANLRYCQMYNTIFDFADLTRADVTRSIVGDITGGLATLDFVNSTASEFLQKIDPNVVIETEPRDLDVQ